MPKLARITVYPIKSLDGCGVERARVLPSGALEFDRRWALFDEQGALINGKRDARLHQLRATYGSDLTTVELQQGNSRARFCLTSEREAASQWFSAALGFGCRLHENAAAGMPDDVDAPGPTLISAASLAAIAAWFPALPLAELRRRFRANFEVGGCEAFWEDQLAGDGGEEARFVVGGATFRGRRVCQRCVVPTRDSQTGDPTSHFAKIFAQRREESLPSTSPVDQFDHFYRFAINTEFDSLPNGVAVRVGDSISRIH